MTKYRDDAVAAMGEAQTAAMTYRTRLSAAEAERDRARSALDRIAGRVAIDNPHGEQIGANGAADIAAALRTYYAGEPDDVLREYQEDLERVTAERDRLREAVEAAVEATAARDIAARLTGRREGLEAAAGYAESVGVFPGVVSAIRAIDPTKIGET